MICTHHREWADLPVLATYSEFALSGQAAEYHLSIRITAAESDTPTQFTQLEEALSRWQREYPHTILVWRRYFLSDVTNQYAFLRGYESEDAALSVVQQAPGLTKAALWAYFVTSESSCVFKNMSVQATELIRPYYRHFYHTQLRSSATDEEKQTTDILDRYTALLATQACTLSRHCIRTWLFVRDIDLRYAGMVKARRACFEREGLTVQTHFIASTGIEGRHTDPRALVTMDAYAVHGLETEQVRYLDALDHLNRTSEYGVTFERGTMVQYGDRRHIFISGTASINKYGEIVHPGDLSGQLDCLFGNIRALLVEADASMHNVMQMIVYVRDPGDYAAVVTWIDAYFPQVPRITVCAAVCRPGWLVEVECIAVTSDGDNRFPVF